MHSSLLHLCVSQIAQECYSVLIIVMLLYQFKKTCIMKVHLFSPMSKTARHRADVAREEVINYPWGLIFIVRGDLNQIATEHRVKMRAVAHSSLTEAETNEYLEEIWIDANYTRECLQLAISEKQDLIDKILADNRVLKKHLKLVKTLENEAALLLKKQ